MLKKVKEKTIFGIKLYEKFRSDDLLSRKYLFGVYREDVSFIDFSEYKRTGYFLGLPLWWRIYIKNKFGFGFGKSTKLFSLSIDKKLENSLNKLFFMKPIIPVNGKKTVIVFWANSGEVSILVNMFFDQLLRELNIKDPEKELVVLCTKSYHKEILELYYPTIVSIVAKPRYLRYLTGDVVLGDWRVKLCFPGKYFAEFEAKAKSGFAINYIDWMQIYFNFSKPVTLKKPDIGILTRNWESVKQQLCINEEIASKTVIFFRDSFSSIAVPQSTWDEIESDVKKSGLLVFNNISDRTDQKYLSYNQIYSFVTHAHSVVCVRSGVADFISSIDNRLTVLYTPFRDRGFNTPAKTSLQVFQMFSLEKYWTIRRCDSDLVEIIIK